MAWLCRAEAVRPRSGRRAVDPQHRRRRMARRRSESRAASPHCGGRIGRGLEAAPDAGRADEEGNRLRAAQGRTARHPGLETLMAEACHEPVGLLPAHFLLEPLFSVRLGGLHPCAHRRNLFVHGGGDAPPVLLCKEASMTVEGGSRARDLTLEEIEVIIPNLKRRYSGGTAVNRTIAPLIAKRCRALWLGPDRPDGIEGLSLSDLVRLRFRPPKGRAARIWHARRNTEMLLGLVLK